MISAAFYQPIYLLVVALLTFFISKRYFTYQDDHYFTKSKNEGVGVILSCLMAIFIGLRPLSFEYFCDMTAYDQVYKYYSGTAFIFNPLEENILFDNLLHWWASMNLGSTTFFLLISVVYFCGAFLGIKRLFKENSFIAYLVFLGAFSTFSYGTNGIKAGAAASIFILALSCRDNIKFCIPLMLVSLGFHHSMQVPIAAFLLTVFFKNPKYYYWGWLFCLLMAIAHVSVFVNLFASFSDQTGSEYLTNTGQNGDYFGGKGGFRYDFVLYSSMPVLVGYLIEMKKKLPVSRIYGDLIHLYICINSVWMLCMYSSYTNRIAYLSWFLYPVVLIYPYLNEKIDRYRYSKFAKVVLAHIGFTLFMFLIYY